VSEGFSTWSELTPSHYTAPQVLERERARIFDAAWTPVGLLSDLRADRDFICASVAGRSVVVQNFDGELRAFENVCTHRQSPLRLCERGNGPLRCPYHGWTFDGAGLPVGIPQRRSFGDMSQALLQQLALDRWALEVVGPFVFVARKPLLALRDALGPLADELSSALGSAQRCLDRNAFELACNWKVMLENGLDAYHVPLVHGQTLHKHGLNEVARERHGDHSVGRFVVASSGRVLRALRYAFPEAELSERYTHYLIYPNIYVVSVYGLFLVLSRIDPLSASAARFESTVFVTWDGDQGNKELREELNASNAAFFRTGYQEDKLICERVQHALTYTARRALFGAEEERIAMFHQSWSRDMTEAHA
jgi:phenylpropionate dioxygenase-like ring-hydroxylating dioxygenase large terminal subunit